MFTGGGGIATGLLKVEPSSVERLTNTVGTLSVPSCSGIDEINHACVRLAVGDVVSLARSKKLLGLGLWASALAGIRASNSCRRGRLQPMSEAPPSKKRPT